ncbi:MAG: ferredoxin [Clostridiaceae bacterium]
MNPVVDQDLCIGCGLCTSICPEVFEMNDDGKAAVIEGADFAAVEDTLKEAVESCPVAAITLE